MAQASKPPPRRRGTAAVTGASSGIGLAYARQLAAAGYDLLLVARRAERLRALADELGRACHVAAEPLVADLARDAEVDRVVARLGTIDDVAILVNNAGFGTAGSFATTDVAGAVAMIEVHVVASVRLCHAVLPGLIARRRGVIVNVASVAAFLPVPGNVTYGATKAFLVAFSEGLHQELRGSGIRVQALCPGFTRTEFHDAAGYEASGRSRIPAFLWMSADDVVAASLRGLRRNEAVCVPGLANQAVVAVARTGLPALLADRLGGLRRRLRQ
ncbi:MAG TPA: SDR family oxidoreductase [Gemmataceae bacterium]|nr:SDR family oxidoreductase [Gemmataceae bacterium]